MKITAHVNNHTLAYIDQNLVERHRIIKELAKAMIFCLQLEEDYNIALRLNSEPTKSMAAAIEVFIREQTCALSNIEIIQCFDVLRDRLLERISDLYE